MNNSAIAYGIAPWLSVSHGEKAVSFYKKAFGATEMYRLEDPDGGVVVQLSVSGAAFWVSGGIENQNEEELLGGNNVRMILTVPNPEAVYAQALAAGAEGVYPVGEEHGWKLGRIVDPFGLHWEIGYRLGEEN